VHCLVPGGALAPDGRTWRRARGTYLVPVRALSASFRGRFVAHWRRVLPHVPVPPAVWATPWVVFAKPTVQGAACVLRYLARYVHRAAITNARIVQVDPTTVTFRHQDSRTRSWRTMTLRGPEFLRRLLQHVLPRGFHKVRYYGFWRPHAAALRARLAHQLTRVAVSATACAAPTDPVLPRCAACGVGRLHVIRWLVRSRAPSPTAQPP
jgi:hypothetical protein